MFAQRETLPMASLCLGSFSLARPVRAAQGWGSSSLEEPSSSHPPSFPLSSDRYQTSSPTHSCSLSSFELFLRGPRPQGLRHRPESSGGVSAGRCCPEVAGATPVAPASPASGGCWGSSREAHMPILSPSLAQPPWWQVRACLCTGLGLRRPELLLGLPGPSPPRASWSSVGLTGCWAGGPLDTIRL